MARFGAALGLLILCTACDSAGDPTPRSLFFQQGPRDLDVSGIVRRGEDGVAGAVVHVSPSQGSVGQTFVGSTSTDTVGFYRVTGPVPSVYDLSFVMPNGADGRTDVLVFREVGYRYLEPQLDVSTRSLQRSWAGNVQVRLDEPLAQGHTILFLAAGDGVYGATGTLEKGIEVRTAKFEQKAIVRAIEYDAAKGLTSASAYGFADVISNAGTPTTLQMHLDPITDSATPSFTLDAPPGFVPESVAIRFNSSRSSDALMVSMKWGESVKIPIIADQTYTYQLRASRADGAIADSGEQNFDPKTPVAISLPVPPDPILPAAGATIGAGDTIAAIGNGILEHVFEPKLAGGAALRIVGTSIDTSLPDLSDLSVSRSTGEYNWTVRRFSTMTAVENVWGQDARRNRPSATSAPRTITLR